MSEVEHEIDRAWRNLCRALELTPSQEDALVEVYLRTIREAIREAFRPRPTPKADATAFLERVCREHRRRR
jgi:hypothetical protein